MGKLRILNTKTGEVKFREAHIANNAKLLKSYGYILQDLGSDTIKDSPNEKVKAEYEKLTASELHVAKIIQPVIEHMTEGISEGEKELVEALIKTEPIKRGRKPNQNK
jgi:hypothetical protein